MWDPCECQAELGDTAGISEVHLCVLLGLSCIGRPLWDQCECQAEFGDIAKITVFLCHVDKLV